MIWNITQQSRRKVSHSARRRAHPFDTRHLLCFVVERMCAIWFNICAQNLWRGYAYMDKKHKRDDNASWAVCNNAFMSKKIETTRHFHFRYAVFFVYHRGNAQQTFCLLFGPLQMVLLGCIYIWNSILPRLKSRCITHTQRLLWTFLGWRIYTPQNTKRAQCTRAG